MAVSKVYAISDEDFQQLIKSSKNFSQCIATLGYEPNGRHAYDLIRRRCNELNISYSHFYVEGNGASFFSTQSLDDILVKNSTYQNISSLKKRLLNSNLLEYKCALCGNTGEWQGKPLTLQLDHINGENHDNRLENLRWVCPNCNSQLDTTNGKNIKNKHKVEHKYFCSECGKPVSRGQTRCKKCASFKSRKVARPDALKLAKMVKENGFAFVGKQYGVSGRAVQKWFEDFGIPYRKQELIAWYNEQIGIEEKPKEEKPKGVFSQPKPVKQIDPNTGNVINTFSSQKAACKALGVHPSDHIGQVCKGIRKTAYKYFWQYV